MAWVQHSVALGNVGQFSSEYVMRLNSRTGNEDSPMSSVICDWWLCWRLSIVPLRALITDECHIRWLTVANRSSMHLLPNSLVACSMMVLWAALLKPPSTVWSRRCTEKMLLGRAGSIWCVKYLICYGGLRELTVRQKSQLIFLHISFTGMQISMSVIIQYIYNTNHYSAVIMIYR